MSTRYRVTITPEERKDPKALTRKGKTPDKKFIHARALLLCDASPDGPEWKVADVAEALGITNRALEHLKKRFVEQGLEAARLFVRGSHHHVCPHAGHRYGQRSRDQLFPLPGTGGTARVRKSPPAGGRNPSVGSFQGLKHGIPWGQDNGFLFQNIQDVCRYIFLFGNDDHHILVKPRIRHVKITRLARPGTP